MPGCATFSGGLREAAMASSVIESPSGAVTERRISWLTLMIGLAAGLLVALLRDRLWGAGLGIGAALAWLNFRWLRRGLDALVLASTAQAGKEKPTIPLLSYFAIVFRYGLIALAVYVIFVYLRVPLVSMVAGLCALGAATVVASVYEILRPVG
jgi:small-conductance mechanosensitive channel